MFHGNIANKRENPIKLISHDGGFAFKAGGTYFTFIVYNLIKNGFIILGVQFELALKISINSNVTGAIKLTKKPLDSFFGEDEEIVSRDIF